MPQLCTNTSHAKPPVSTQAQKCPRVIRGAEQQQRVLGRQAPRCGVPRVASAQYFSPAPPGAEGRRPGFLSPAQPLPPGVRRQPRGLASTLRKEGHRPLRSPSARRRWASLINNGGKKEGARAGGRRRAPTLTGSGVSTTSLTEPPMQGRHCPMASPPACLGAPRRKRRRPRPRPRGPGSARPGLGPAGAGGAGAEAGTGSRRCPR